MVGVPFGFLRIKFQLPRLVRLPFLSSGFGVAPGVDELLSTERPRCSVEPARCSSSVISPVGVVASPGLLRDEKMDVDLVSFQLSNLLEDALRVIFEMNVGFEAGVDSREGDAPADNPDVVRSRLSRVSIVLIVGAIDEVSLLFLLSGGELPDTS